MTYINIMQIDNQFESSYINACKVIDKAYKCAKKYDEIHFWEQPNGYEYNGIWSVNAIDFHTVFSPSILLAEIHSMIDFAKSLASRPMEKVFNKY